MQTELAAEPLTLRVSGLELRAGRRTLVAGFNWQHSAGKTAWLTGENGTGKSALLRAFVGRQRPHRGTVGWHPALGEAPSWITPSMSVPPDVYVADWVDFVAGVSGADDRHPLLEQLFPRSASQRRRFAQLSTGEAKRLLLWAALGNVRGPVVLDEPYEHLSRSAKSCLTLFLRELAAKTVVIIATNQDVPLLPGEQLLVLDESSVSIERAGHEIAAY